MCIRDRSDRPRAVQCLSAYPETTDPLHIGHVCVGGDRLVLDDQDPDLSHVATATRRGNRTVNTAPTNTAPTNTAPTNTAPTNTAPTNTAPTNTAPTNTAPTNTAPTTATSCS